MTINEIYIESHHHRLEEDHEFDWENIAVLDEKSQYRKILMSEILHIRKQTRGLNLQTDLEGLPKTYFPIVDGRNKYQSVIIAS